MTFFLVVCYNKHMETRFIRYSSEDNAIFFHHTINAVSEKPILRKPEIHDRLEFLYLKQGNITYKIDGLEVNLHSGDLILINARQLHSLTIDLSQPYDRYVIRFPESILPNNETISHNLYTNLFSNQSFQFRLLHKDVVEKYNLPHFFSSWEQKYNPSDKFYYLFLISSVIQLLIEINKAIEENSPVAHEKSHPPTIQGIINYINDNLESKLLIKDIANALHFSEYYILHLFKNYMQISLKQYIDVKRMSLAVALLKKGVKPTEISLRLGYSTYSAFYQRYCKTFNRKPSQTPSNNQDIFNQIFANNTTTIEPVNE